MTPTGDAEGLMDGVSEVTIGQVEKRDVNVDDATALDCGATFLRSLVECHATDPVVSLFLAYINRVSSTHNLLSPINFPLDHPVQEVARFSSLTFRAAVDNSCCVTPPTVGDGAEICPSVCLSVCLFHAYSSTTVHFSSVFTTEH